MKAGELCFKAQQLDYRCVHITTPPKELDDLGLSLLVPCLGVQFYFLSMDWRIMPTLPGLLKIHEKSSATGKAPGTSM